MERLDRIEQVLRGVLLLIEEETKSYETLAEVRRLRLLLVPPNPSPEGHEGTL